MAQTDYEKDLYENAKNPEYSTGSFINDAFALMDEYEGEDLEKNSHFFQNFQRYKISIGAVSKFINNLDKENLQKNVLWLNYKHQVLTLVLNDSLNEIGINGYIDIHNMGSYADIILHRHSSFYIVINITIIEDGYTTKLEPYIFEIARVQNLSTPEEEDKKMRIFLNDIMSSICINHNIVTVIKLTEGKIATRTTYKEVFEDILNYIKTHIKINMLGKYDYRKDLYFKDDIDIDKTIRREDDDEAQGNEEMPELVKASFAKMPRDATIMDAIRILQKDCGRTLKTPKTFSALNQTAGDLIIPFYFKEEYQQIMPHYTVVWPAKQTEKSREEDNKDYEAVINSTFDAIDEALKGNFNTDKSKKMSEAWAKQSSRPMIINHIYGGKESRLFYRNMTMRDIYMPFYLAFGEKELRDSSGNSECYIFESMNPELKKDGTFTDYENVFKTPVGYKRNVILHGLQSFPFDADVVKKRWKNIVFVDTVKSTSSVLIFLRWFYNYFCSIFLNNDTIGGISYMPNLLPSFLAKSMNNRIGEAEGEGSTLNSLYDTHNSNLYICRTPDSRNEALREMGRNIASFILSNNRFMLKVDGDIFRRPNEIIKFTQFTGGRSFVSPLNSMVTGGINMSADPYTLLYVTNVTHIFQADGYYNMIEGCKFCESMNMGVTEKIITDDASLDLSDTNVNIA